MVHLKLSFGGGKSKKSRYFTFMGYTYSPKGLLTDLGPKNSEMRPIWARVKVWTLHAQPQPSHQSPSGADVLTWPT